MRFFSGTEPELIALAIIDISAQFLLMGLPDKPVTLSAEQVGELNRQLSTMRHDINNHMMMISAAAELSRSKPDTASHWVSKALEQVPRVTQALKAFSSEFERTLGISKP